ncbi:uncharacterized protein LOC133534050 [Cydia pomonella]|uniref:uncharacterized protein LOC133534050 n=1 Tax=Cydia pomonella TaxID=82600 RepID=UPI002ADDE8F1|nr:uncharacterized protein LOC133534050 [Cydia pomonella]
MVEVWEQRLAHPNAGHHPSGHGCFGRYLKDRARRELTAVCHHCDCPEDTAQHTLEVCPAWEEERRILSDVVGHDLSLPSVVRSMVDSDRSWRAVLDFCEAVMVQKERAERDREDDPASQPLRRKRVGRRRLAYDRRLPP